MTENEQSISISDLHELLELDATNGLLARCAAIEMFNFSSRHGTDDKSERAKVAAENNPPQSQASTLAWAQPEPAAPVAKPDNVVVIEHQDAISAFLSSRDFGKEAGKVRAILVEFVKFEEQFGRKAAA